MNTSVGQRSAQPSTALALIGFMGAGKSTIGRLAAASLNCPFIDTDVLIEESHGDIPAIFADYGEKVFRQYERDVVSAALTDALAHPSVIALGGGAVTSGDVREALGRLRHVVWLTAPADVLWARVTAAACGRPLALDADQFGRLLEERSALYASIATHEVANDGRRPRVDVANEVARIASATTAAAERGA